MPVPSQPPPSEKIPGDSSGGGLYIAGAVLLIAAAVALFWWKQSSSRPATPQAASATATVAPKPEAPVTLFAPPPPPKDDTDADAGVDAGQAPVKTSGGGAPSGPGPGPCGSNCTGQATSALSSALRGRARVQGCYNRALRTSEISGSMTVSVQIGPSGQVCAASLANDSVHSNEIATCVLNRFRGQTFPPPSGGCVTVNIPIAFAIKQ